MTIVFVDLYFARIYQSTRTMRFFMKPFTCCIDIILLRKTCLKKPSKLKLVSLTFSTQLCNLAFASTAANYGKIYEMV